MRKKYFLLAIMCHVLSLTYAQDERDKSITELYNTLEGSSSELPRCNALLDLAFGYILKPGSEARDLDSADLLTRQAEALNKKSLGSKPVEAKIDFTWSNLFREKNDLTNGKNHCEKSIDIYKSMAPSDALGDAYFELANYYDWNNPKEQIVKRDCYAAALIIFNGTGNKSKQGFALKNMADMDNVMRNYGRAMVELQQALDIYKSIGYPKLQGIYDLLGLVYARLGDYPSAVKYGLLAVKTCEDVKDTSLQLCTIYNRLGISYDTWGRNHSPEALIYLKKAFDIAIKYNDAQSIFLTTIALGPTLCHAGRKKEAVALMMAYINKVEMEDRTDSILVYGHSLQTFKLADEKLQSKKCADILVSLLPLHPGPADQPIQFGYLMLVEYFVLEHEPALAEKYADINLALCSTDPQNKIQLMLAYFNKARADSSAGNFNSAFKHLYRYIDLKDSIFNEKKSFQFTQIQAAFETEKKDNELKILQGQNALNTAELHRTRQVRNTVIAAAFFMLALFYTGYQFKQRSNVRLQKKQDEINQQNAVLKNTIEEKNTLITEKEWLVKEIHHRVKNNMQMIISLLNAQTEFLHHPSALNAIKESRERMQAIALIHQKLYQPDEGTLINMECYIRELVDYLAVSFADAERIRFKLEIAPIELDVSQSLPLGLILNEAITNVFKYAFKKEQQGNVLIELYPVNEKEILLKIADDGQGFSESFDPAESNSLGIQLIKLFAEQLEGNVQFISRNGVEISLIFKHQYSGYKSPSLRGYASKAAGITS